MGGAVFLGAAWGLFCAFARPPIGSTLAQMAVPWLWVAAAAGYLWGTDEVRRTALIGGATLVSANFLYFGVAGLGRAITGDPVISGLRFLVIWTTIGLIIGPGSALVGRGLKKPARKAAAVTMLAAVSMAEPLALWAHVDHRDAHITYLMVAVAGLAMPLVLFRDRTRQGIRSSVLALAALYPLAVFLELTLILLGQVSAPARLL